MNENTSNNKSLVEKAKEYASKAFNEASSNFVYHNYKHTEQVVNAIKELANEFNLSEEEKQNLEVAGWFHDISYSESSSNHENLSAEKARLFLESQQAKSATIASVTAYILATKMNHSPKNLMEMIIRDADCSHLGKKSFDRRNALLRMEWELTANKVFSEKEWLKSNLEFLNKHTFYTTIAKLKWEDTKIKNIKALKKQLKALEVDTNTSKKPKKTNVEKTTTSRSRGVETMYRVTLRNHINLSRIADNKANFLMSINAIIVSLLLGELITDNKPVIALILPSVYFLVVCAITMVLAILAARPNITKGKFSRKGLLDNKTNILFFGNFHKMPLDDFNWGMNELMKNDDLLYNSLTKDLYYLGKVLHKKYQLLRYAFNFFMFGIVSSLLFYFIIMLINK